MANSKANIYPIQLQGAELNLNKYDAEIKQYSGFNKNNSPFVGGCLANVFTKDETQEGSTSENTYIDTNGDVYHVDTEGLWKNDEKVISIRSNTENYFFETEDIDNSDNTLLFCFSDLYKIYKKYETQWNREVLYLNNTRLTDYYDKDDVIKSFQDRLCGVFLSETVFCLVYVYVDSSCHGEIYFFENGTLLNSKAFGFGTIDADYNYTKTTVLLPSDESNALCVFTNKEAYAYIRYTDDFQTITIVTSSGRNQTFTTNYNGSSVTSVSDVLDDVFIESYPMNKAFVVRTKESSTRSTARFGMMALKGLDSNNKLVFNFDYYQSFQMYQANATTSFEIDVSEVRTPYYICLNTQFYGKHSSSSSTTQNTPCVICGYQVIYNGMFNIIQKENGYNVSKYSSGLRILPPIYQHDSLYSLNFNNCYLSGIGGAYVLFTNWNDVDIDTVFINQFERAVYYKDSIGFHKIKQGIPKLRKIGNQIVINYDGINSYDIKRNKTLLFAPNYNNLNKITDVYTQSARYDYACEFPLTGNAGTFYYMASSINEYAQEDNSSILLNPSPFLFNANKAYLSIAYANWGSIGIDINTYFGQSDIVYSVTRGARGLIKNKNLIGLSFPITTDGNVSYSPSLFSEIKSAYGNKIFIKSGSTFYPLEVGNNSEPIMSFFLASGIDNLSEGFIVQGQFYGIINNGLYSLQYSNGVISSIDFVVDVSNLKFCGNTPYQAFFFSKTNRCLYSFTGANVMNQTKFLDKFEDVIGYKYNPATQTIFMITKNEVIAYSAFGTYEISFANCVEVFLLQKGVCLLNDSGNFKYIRYYAENGYTKQNIRLETCFYGMNNQTVTINDCLYVRLFSEEHESGDVEMTASTLSNSGRMTEKTTFKIKSSDWDKMTHSIYLRYQPKEQRGLGVSFSINSPFKIAALSVGSQPDAILIDKVSKTAINAPQRTTNNSEW